MTGVAHQTASSTGPLFPVDATDRLSPSLLFAFLLCWIAIVLLVLRLTRDRGRHRDDRRTGRSSPWSHQADPWAGPPGRLEPDEGPREPTADQQGWRVADRLHQVPVQILARSASSGRAARAHDRTAADMLEDLAGPILDAGQRRYRRSWGGVLLHGTQGRETTELAATLASDHGVPLLVVHAHDIVPFDWRPAAAPVFALAATMAPCVLLVEGVDELTDSTAPLVVSRHARRIEHELATAIRSEDPEASVVVIASARSPDAVAPALLQDGCLDRVIAVGTPTARQRRLLIQRELLVRHASFEGALDEAVRLTAGMTQHQLVDAMHETCRAARRRVPTAEPLPVSMVELRAALGRPSGAGPLAIGADREARIHDLVRRAQDPAASFGLILAGDEDNGGTDIARWIAARARRAVAWLQGRQLRSVPDAELEQMVVAAVDQLPVLVVWERLDVLLASEAGGGRRRKGVIAAIDHLAQTPGAAVVATMQQLQPLDPMLVDDGTVEVIWIPAPGFHDRVTLLTHALGHAVLVDTTVEEVAAVLHGVSRAHVLAQCRAAVDAAALRTGTDRSKTLEVLRDDFRRAGQRPPAPRSAQR